MNLDATSTLWIIPFTNPAVFEGLDTSSLEPTGAGFSLTLIVIAEIS